MAFIPTPHCIKVAMNFIIQGKLVTVTFMLETAAAPTPTDMTNAGVVPATWWNGTASPIWSNQVALNNVTAYDQTSASSPQLPFVPTTPVFGGDSHIPVTDNVALVTSPRTINRGRSGRGREYWPGLPTSGLQDAFNWAPSFLVAFLPIFNALRSQLASANIPMVINSRYSGVDPITHKPIPRASGLLQPISSVRADEPIGTQRRRVLAL